MYAFVLQAIKITSVKAQLPYEYYSLPFCKPSQIEYKAENLGMLFFCEGTYGLFTPYNRYGLTDGFYK